MSKALAALALGLAFKSAEPTYKPDPKCGSIIPVLVQRDGRGKSGERLDTSRPTSVLYIAVTKAHWLKVDSEAL